MAKASQAVPEIAFAIVLGPSWAVFLAGLALAPRGPYEIDLYAEAGVAVWVAALANVAATVWLLHASPRLGWLAYWNLGALLLAVVATPYFLGYYAYGRSDVLTGIGNLAGALRAGAVTPENPYPATTFVGVAVVYTTGLAPHIASWMLALASSLLLLLALAALALEGLTGRSGQSWLQGRLPPYALLVAFVPYCAWIQATGIPNFVFFAVAAAAVVAAVAVPPRGMGRLVVLFLLGGAAAIGHPFVAAFLLVVFVGLAVFGREGSRIDAGLALAFLGLALAAWAFGNPGLSTAIERNLEFFETSGDGHRVAEEVGNKAQRGGLDLLGWGLLIVLHFSRYIIPAAVIVLGAGALRTRTWFRAQPAWAWALLLAGASLQLALLFNPVVRENAVRIANMNYAVLGLVPLAAIGLVAVARIGLTGRVVAAGLVFVTIGATVLGTFDSPLISRPNAEYGDEEVLAGRWLLSERGPHSIYNPTGVFENRAISLHHDLVRRQNPLRPNDDGILPDHFVAQPPGEIEDFYIAVPRFDEVLYDDLYPHIGRFTAQDYERLDARYGIPRVYDSSGIRAYMVQLPPRPA